MEQIGNIQEPQRTQLMSDISRIMKVCADAKDLKLTQFPIVDRTFGMLRNSVEKCVKGERNLLNNIGSSITQRINSLDSLDEKLKQVIGEEEWQLRECNEMKAEMEEIIKNKEGKLKKEYKIIVRELARAFQNTVLILHDLKMMRRNVANKRACVEKINFNLNYNASDVKGIAKLLDDHIDMNKRSEGWGLDVLDRVKQVQQDMEKVNSEMGIIQAKARSLWR